MATLGDGELCVLRDVEDWSPPEQSWAEEGLEAVVAAQLRATLLASPAEAGSRVREKSTVEFLS